MIQVRNVPDSLHGELVRRARKLNRTLTDYIQEILEQAVSRPPAQEVFDRIRKRSPVDLGRMPAELLQEERRTRGER